MIKTKLFIIATLFVFAFSSCQKDLATDWSGTYAGISGSTFSRVIISKVDKTTIKLDLQTNVLGTPVTYATVNKGKLNSATSLTVDEDGAILGSTDVFHFTGVGSLSGNSLTLSGQAQSKTDATDIRPYTFTGTK